MATLIPPDAATAAAVGDLLARIAGRTAALLRHGRETLALPPGTAALLEAAAAGRAVDQHELSRARAAAETLLHELIWTAMKVRAGVG